MWPSVMLSMDRMQFLSQIANIYITPLQFLKHNRTQMWKGSINAERW